MPDISSMFPVTRLADRYNRKANIAITSKTAENIPVNAMMKTSRTIDSDSMTPPKF
jgi:ribosomal protein L39E